MNKQSTAEADAFRTYSAIKQKARKEKARKKTTQTKIGTCAVERPEKNAVLNGTLQKYNKTKQRTKNYVFPFKFYNSFVRFPFQFALNFSISFFLRTWTRVGSQHHHHNFTLFCFGIQTISFYSFMALPQNPKQNFCIFRNTFFVFSFFLFVNELSTSHFHSSSDRAFVFNMKLFYDYYYSNDMNTFVLNKNISISMTHQFYWLIQKQKRLVAEQQLRNHTDRKRNSRMVKTELKILLYWKLTVNSFANVQFDFLYAVNRKPRANQASEK